MLTKNFHNLIGSMLQSNALTAKGMLPITDVYGMQGFTIGQFSQFPYARTASYTANRYAAGITIGTGSKTEDQSDFNLESPLKNADASVTLTSTSVITDNGEPYLRYNVTVTNVSSDELTLTEICYKQTVTRATVYEGSATENVVVMLDRTLITPPVTIAPSEAAVIEYRLRTESDEGSTVDGVKVVSWQFGSDEDVAAMIAAAHDGTIDLRECGWQVGDMRPVEISAFEAGGVSNSPQVIDLVITSFDDYNGCGCVMQVDFAEALSSALRMHPTDSNDGGYAQSEMCTETLPALVDALPSWLSSILVEFDAKTSEGNNFDTVTDVTGNKLCLRSEVEIRGSIGGGSKESEGEAVGWYQSDTKMRQKRRGRVGSANTYWFRSPASNATQYVRVSSYNAAQFAGQNASTEDGIAPFMCL